MTLPSCENSQHFFSNESLLHIINNFFSLHNIYLYLNVESINSDEGYNIFRVVLIAFGKLPGDWEHHRDVTKMLASIEPVIEGYMQLFFQTIILNIVNGPGEDEDHNRLIDFRHLLYDDDIWSKIMYIFLLATSLTSVGTSLAKVSTNVCKINIKLIILLASGFWKKSSNKENYLFSIFKTSHNDYNKIHDTELFDECHCKVGLQN